MATTWTDVTEASTVNLSKEGFKVVRTFIFTGAYNANGYATVQGILASGACPQRGAAHPANPFAVGSYSMNLYADIINGDCKDGDPSCVIVTVNYARLNAVTGQPLGSGEGWPSGHPALLTFGSSVQSQKTVVDNTGALLVCTNNSPTYPTLYDQYNNEIGDTSNTEADIQIPTNLLRFSRRETALPVAVAQDYVGYVNNADYTVAGVTYPKHTLLMSRIDGETQDEGASFVCVYEVIFNFNTWDVGGFYTPYVDAYYPQGGTIVCSAGQIISDETPTVFQIYGAADFGPLNLT